MSANKTATMHVSAHDKTTGQNVRDFVHAKFEHPSSCILLHEFCPEKVEAAEIAADTVVVDGSSEEPVSFSQIEIQYFLGWDPEFMKKKVETGSSGSNTGSKTSGKDGKKKKKPLSLYERFSPTSFDEALIFWFYDCWHTPDLDENPGEAEGGREERIAVQRRKCFMEVADWEPRFTQQKKAKYFLMLAFWVDSKKRGLVDKDVAHFAEKDPPDSLTIMLFLDLVY
jgi:hypothetical protein